MKCRERLESYLRQQQVGFDVQQHLTAFTLSAAEGPALQGRG